MNTDDYMTEQEGRTFLKKHWKTMIVFGGIAIAAIVAALYVLTWFVAIAQSTGFVPATLGAWSVGTVINFIIHLIFWEVLLVLSWVIVLVAIVFYRWWKTLDESEKQSKPKGGKREGGDAFGFFIGIMWLIVVWLDGRWSLPFNSWAFNDWVYSFLAALGWTLIIFGIPMVLYFIYWIRQDTEVSEVTSIE